jgi:hypothetical protein
MHRIAVILFIAGVLSFGAEELPIGVSWSSKEHSTKFVEIGSTNQNIYRFMVHSSTTNYMGYYQASHVTNIVYEIGRDHLIRKKYNLAVSRPLDKQELVGFFDQILKYEMNPTAGHPHLDWNELGDWNNSVVVKVFTGVISNGVVTTYTVEPFSSPTRYRIKTTIKPQMGTTNSIMERKEVSPIHPE